MALSQEELDNRFSYHAPAPGQPEIYQQIRAKARELADLINDTCPELRPEKFRAIDKIDEVVMLANAAIARGTQPA